MPFPQPPTCARPPNRRPPMPLIQWTPHTDDILLDPDRCVASTSSLVTGGRPFLRHPRRIDMGHSQTHTSVPSCSQFSVITRQPSHKESPRGRGRSHVQPRLTFFPIPFTSRAGPLHLLLRCKHRQKANPHPLCSARRAGRYRSLKPDPTDDPHRPGAGPHAWQPQSSNFQRRV